MKKILWIIITGLCFLAACGGSDIDFSVDNSPHYVTDGETEIIIMVEDNGEAVSGMTIAGSLEMAKMDHGVIEANFTDNGDGSYTANVDLPMGGEWIMETETELDGKVYEETITFNVSEG
ncbi:FixH family protein [Oceanobacillus alkalisoli]|uniref:FixH family protein n=1 Tax=Oceanobacillus alkalisoli TaxID=2925113 RepID=UPI001EE4815B|nr:FixH family protein [Oceanobacillus alkalisoli]MCG5102160.1 FixH family protein [Oceanobacillus alkalisoli]